MNPNSVVTLLLSFIFFVTFFVFYFVVKNSCIPFYFCSINFLRGQKASPFLLKRIASLSSRKKRREVMPNSYSHCKPLGLSSSRFRLENLGPLFS
jgi:hypothetical protein